MDSQGTPRLLLPPPPSLPPSASAPIGEEWLRKYLYRIPSMILVLVPISGVDSGGMTSVELTDAINGLQCQSHERGQRLAIIIQSRATDVLSAAAIQERRDRLAKATRLPVSCIFVVGGGDINSTIIPSVLQYTSQHHSHFYRERLKKYRRKLQQSTDLDDSTTSKNVYSSLRYQFKAGMMELFLGEPDPALRSFNNAYAAVIQYCRRSSERDEAFLSSVRWTCDVIAFKIVWILMSRGDRRDADEYFAGHVAWYAGSHTMAGERALVIWKCQLYESMSRLVQAATNSIVKDGKSPMQRPTAGRSAAYYAYLAARNAISLQALLSDQAQRVSLATDRVLPLLALAYDQYHQQPGHHHSMLLQLGRLLSSQYLLLGDLDEAKGALIKLRRAYSPDWRLIMADVLMELLALAERTEDYRLAVECYWEYAALQAAQVMEEFDTHLTQLCHRLTVSSSIDRLVLDMSRIRPGFVSLAARLHQSPVGGVPRGATVDRAVEVTILLSNMTPLIMNIACITVRLLLSEEHIEEEQVITPESNDVLPGVMAEFRRSFHLPRHGMLVLDSIAIDLADLPLRLHWHSNSLCTVDAHLKETSTLGGWDEVTINGRFWRTLEMGPFLEEAHRLMVGPVLPEVELEAHQPRPLFLGGHPCPLLLCMHNTRAYPIEIRLHFNPGSAFDLTAEEVKAEDRCKNENRDDIIEDKFKKETIDWEGEVKGAGSSLTDEMNIGKQMLDKDSTRLANLTITLTLDPKEQLTRTILIRQPQQRGDLSLRIDHYSKFVGTDHRLLLSDEIVHAFYDLPLTQAEPLTITSEYIPSPTDYALVSGDGDSAGNQVDAKTGTETMPPLLKYYAFVQLTNQLDGEIVLHRWSLDEGRFVCLYPSPNSDRQLRLEKDESLSLLFEVSSAPPALASREQLSPSLVLEAVLAGDPRPWKCHHQLPGISLYPRSLLIIPFVGAMQLEGTIPKEGTLSCLSPSTSFLPQPLAQVGRPLAHRWRVWNGEEGGSREVLIRVEPAEPWVYMGVKQLRVRIDAASFYELSGWLVPLLAGSHAPPSLSLQAAVAAGGVIDPTVGGKVLLYETLARPPIYVLP